ncbi:hypothetical protein [Methylobacillus glycogenes]|uniref:hypothetical protein n=1 Tax=Methylobacillus glycogenes TaxID=406 RepID=UPI0004705BFD|nr:hypothetical protein [Methylobacillus glycogenes]
MQKLFRQKLSREPLSLPGLPAGLLFPASRVLLAASGKAWLAVVLHTLLLHTLLLLSASTTVQAETRYRWI